MTTLTALDLSYNRFTDGGLGLFNKSPLQDLSLQFCAHLTDKGLSSFLAGKPITSLNLRMADRDGKVTREILQVLMDLPLVKLVVDDRLFSDVDLEALFQAVPSITEVQVFEYDDDRKRHDENRVAKVLRR